MCSFGESGHYGVGDGAYLSVVFVDDCHDHADAFVADAVDGDSDFDVVVEPDLAQEVGGVGYDEECGVSFVEVGSAAFFEGGGPSDVEEGLHGAVVGVSVAVEVVEA